VRVVLVSTYELGHQPLHLAAPAAALLDAGHEVRCVDLSVDVLDDTTLTWAEALACSVPMHTAMRMARSVCRGVRVVHPDLPICLYGLYAVLDGAEGTPPVADIAVAGEYAADLVSWIDAGAPRVPRAGTLGGPLGERVAVALRRRSGIPPRPARHLLPPLERYARLVLHGEERLVGYVEASRGCAHRCRHCPVPVVYDGRTRVEAEEAVVADVAQLVEAGARHITFGDPDFCNGPHHARRVLAAVHGAFPSLTFDVTVKVEHVLAHRHLWPEFAQAGVVFVVSAFESASDRVLGILDKGHTAADELGAVAVLRASGIEPRPSLLPFTPWTEAKDMVDLLDLLAKADLVGNVDPVQYAIRLLVPPGSLLLASGALATSLGPYDEERLGWSWQAPDRRLDTLADELQALADRAGSERWAAAATYEQVVAATGRVLGARPRSPGRTRTDPRLRSAYDPEGRPRLTEPWFCCAEPTDRQFAATEVAAPTPDTRCLVP